MHPGVFVSKAATGDWQPDPDVPGSEMHELVHRDGVWAGLTRFTASEGPVSWTPEQREVALVLEGSVRIEIEGGTCWSSGSVTCSRCHPGSKRPGT